MTREEEVADRVLQALLESGVTAQSLLDILYRHGKVQSVKGGAYRAVGAPDLLRVDL